MAKKDNILIPLDQFLNTYLVSEKGLKENTRRSYKYAFQLLFRYLSEEKGVSPDCVTFNLLDTETITGFLNWLETGRNCSAVTRNQRLAVILSFSEYAQHHSSDAATVFRRSVLNVPFKKAKTESRTYFTKDELKILFSLPDINTSIGRRDRTILMFMYASGARAQEVCDLLVRDITFSDNKVYIILHGKGDKARKISIAATPMNELKDHLIRTGRIKQPSKHVFSSQTHEQMTISCIEEIYAKYLTAAKELHPDKFLQHYSPHSMRHTTATHMIQAAVPLIVIKNFLGHSSVQTTEIYAEVTQELLDQKTKEWNKTWLNTDRLKENPSPKKELLNFLKV